MSRVIEIRLSSGEILSASDTQRFLGVRQFMGIEWFPADRFQIGDYVDSDTLPIGQDDTVDLPTVIRGLSRVVAIIEHDSDRRSVATMPLRPVAVPESVLDEVRSV